MISRPGPTPIWDYDFRLHDWHVQKAANIAYRHKNLLIRTTNGKRTHFNIMPTYSLRPVRRGRSIPDATLNVMRAHITSARRIERRINGHA